MSYKDYIKAKRSLVYRAKKLKIQDHFNGIVKVALYDESYFELTFSSIEEDENWLYVFTEHYGNMIFEKELIKEWSYQKWKKVNA
jgi:hypothetical protein